MLALLIETIAENKKKQESAAKRRQRLLKQPTAAKLGCAFSHSAERIVDELGLLYPENPAQRTAHSWFNSIKKLYLKNLSQNLS